MEMPIWGQVPSSIVLTPRFTYSKLQGGGPEVERSSAGALSARVVIGSEV